MKRIVFGICFGFAIAIFLEVMFVVGGGVSLETKAKELPLERFFAGMALRASMRGHENDKSPFPPDRENLDAGARIYSKHCSVCHGERNAPRPPIALGEYPSPPQLLTADESVADDPVGETFWKAKNGIRFTGMPGFRETFSEKELWQVSLFLSRPKQGLNTEPSTTNSQR
jgi:thiosulfate dehydrogenase